MFLIRALNLGGAQSQMVLLAKELRTRGHEVNVVAFYDGVHNDILRASDVGVYVLHKRGRWEVLRFFWRLNKLTRRLAPDVIYGYLATCNILTSLLSFLTPTVKAVWGVRTAHLKLEYYGWLPRFLNWIEPQLAGKAALVVANSQAGLRSAVQSGVPAEKMIVIPNGIAVEQFYPDTAARSVIRATWRVAPEEILIGVVGRIDPIKEHKLFFSAAAELSRIRPQVRFVCVGEAVNRAYRADLEAAVQSLGLAEKVVWAEAQYDMLRVYNALDILTNCSSSEGFSNVIGEAMACGVQCVVTDVGDSALIIGDAGVVVPPNDPAALLNGWLTCLRQSRPTINTQARQRIHELYSVRALAEQTEAALLAIV
mgnify:CR=1 FL=1